MNLSFAKTIKLSIVMAVFVINHASYALNDSQVKTLVMQLKQDEKVMSLYSEPQLVSILKAAKYKQSVIDAFHRTAESLTWGEYRKIFIKPSLISSGIEFGRKHAQLLARAEKTYGVPQEIILAILGVETAFGTNKGKHRVIDSLATLSLGFERRKDFFFGELKSLLILGKEHGVNVSSALGSYAGAMGYPQFISSSYLAYAVDFDNDGKIDLIHSIDDAIGSIANYLAVHGWQTNQAIYSELENTSTKINEYVTEERKTLFTVNDLTNIGINLTDKHSKEMPVSLIKLTRGNTVDYRAAFDNFYVITTYNHSKLYAMAVTELSERIQQGLAR